MTSVFLPSVPYTLYKKLFRVVAKIALTLHWIRLRAQAAIAKIEADIESLIQLISNSWILFLDLAERVQRAGVWRLHAPTWKSYCRQRWNIDSSRISQFRGALPYASAFLSAGLEAGTEGHIRLLRKNVPLESPKMIGAWKLGNEVAQAEHRAPTEALYHHAHEVLLEAEKTGGVVQIDGADYDIGDTSQAVRAVQARIKEVQRIAQEGQAHRLIEVTAIQGEGGLWKLESNEALPKRIKFKVYI